MNPQCHVLYATRPVYGYGSGGVTEVVEWEIDHIISVHTTLAAAEKSQRRYMADPDNNSRIETFNLD